MNGHRASLGGHWDEVRRAALPVAPFAPTRITATIEAGRCLDVFITPGDEIPSLEVTAEDNTGRILASARVVGRDRDLVVCSRVTTEIGVSLQAARRAGLVALSIGRSSIGGDAEIAKTIRVTHVGASTELVDARARVDKRARGPRAAPAKTIAKGDAKVGVRTSTDVALPPGCARLDVVVGRPFTEVAATLWDARGTSIAEAHASGSATLYSCGHGGPARVDLEPLQSGGPYAVELRADRVAPDALVAHPVAAARLLGRLAAAGATVDASIANGAVVVALEPSVLKTLPLVIPPNACATVTAALDSRRLRRLDLRLADLLKTRDGEVTRLRASRRSGSPSAPGRPV